MAANRSIPSTMRAVAVERFGEEPRLMRLPTPTPGEGELLVRLLCAALNPFDWTLAQGLVADRAPHVFPLVLGVDGVGVVEQVGPGARRFEVGDSVYGVFMHPPYGRGTYAEYVAVSEDAWISHPPRGVELRLAAALPTAGMSALALIELTHIAQGQSVLIVGATGGVGCFATQLAATRGARVIATASSDAAERMRALGACSTIDHIRDPIAEQVRELEPHGVDVLIDLVSGGEEFATSLELVTEGGHAASTRYAAAQAISSSAPVKAVNLNLTYEHGDIALLERLTAEIDRTDMTVPIDTEISLKDTPAAIATSHSRPSRAKVLVTI